MRSRTLGSAAVGLLLSSLALGAQASPPPQGAAITGRQDPRPQVPGGPTRDGATQPVTGTGKILGRVVSSETGSPLRRALVRITAAEQRVAKMATTDAEGRYQFTDLPAGRYSITVSRNGYVSLQFGQQRPFEPGKPLELADKQVAEKIDFALPRGGVIAGRITDEVGEPLAGIGVRAMRYQYQPDGRRRLMPAGPGGFGPNNIQTDDLGQFRVYGLMPGSYVLSASTGPMGGGGVFISAVNGTGVATPPGNNDGTDGYATTYYPGTASEAEAQAITVSIGQEASAFFSMVSARLSRISGVIRNSQGRPAIGLTLTLRSTQATQVMGIAFGGLTAPDGSFVLQNVTPGDYVVDVRPMGVGRPFASQAETAAEPEFASLPIAVSGQDINGLVITTGPGATLAGRLIFDTTHPPLPTSSVLTTQPLRIVFALIDGGLSMPPMGNMADNGLVDSSGGFELKGLNGKGLFRVVGTSSTVKSVALEGVEITDTPYDFKPGGNVTGLEITLTNTQTTLTGSVRTPRGEAVKDYVVAIFPSNLREGDNPGRFTRSARPDQSGKYVTKGLPAGEYFAAAVESLEQGEQWDPAFQQQIKPRAKTFKLTEGQSLALDLPLLTASP